jgi:hypothetical protein
MTFKKKTVEAKPEVVLNAPVEGVIDPVVAVPLKEKKEGAYIKNERVMFIGAQPIKTVVAWDDAENIRDSGEYEACGEDFPIKASNAIPVNFKDGSNRVCKGFVVRTPKEVMLWALASERT